MPWPLGSCNWQLVYKMPSPLPNIKILFGGKRKKNCPQVLKRLWIKAVWTLKPHLEEAAAVCLWKISLAPAFMQGIFVQLGSKSRREPGSRRVLQISVGHVMSLGILLWPQTNFLFLHSFFFFFKLIHLLIYISLKSKVHTIWFSS